MLGVREKGAGTGDIFFGSHSVDLVFDFVALVGNSEKTDAVHGGVGRAQARSSKAHVVPGKVERIDDEKEECERGGDAENQARARRRAIDLVRHKIGLRGYSASGRVLEEARIEEAWGIVPVA